MSIDIVAVLYFAYENETLILGKTILQSCKPWSCILSGLFPLNLLKSQLDSAKAEGQTSSFPFCQLKRFYGDTENLKRFVEQLALMAGLGAWREYGSSFS